MKNISIFVCLVLILSAFLSSCDAINGFLNSDSTSACTECVDTDNDGSCDQCNTSVIVSFNIYAINDLHGKILADGDQPGIEELTTYLETAKEYNENTILLSSGDMWQGSAESNLTHGQLITEWMNELDFVSMTIGNHEFDWGEEYISSNAELAEFPFLAINIYDTATGKQADFCESSIVIDQGGVQIGIIGAIGDVYSSISGEVVGDMYFKVGSELTSLVKAESERLRREEGVDFVIYSLHSDESDYSNELSNGYVDLVFEGHTHQAYVKADNGGVYHLQNGGENDGISHACAKINKANGNHVVTDAKVIKNNVYESLEEDPIIDELLAKYAEDLNKANEVICISPRYFYSDTILQICSKLYYEAGVEMWSQDYPIVLGGGFMSARSPYNIPAGEVTYADIYSVLPFDNQLVLCSVNGYDLLRFAKNTNKRYYIYTDEYGESVLENVDYNATYYIVTDTYSSTYKYNNLTEVARYTPNVFARDLFAEYLKSIAQDG